MSALTEDGLRQRIPRQREEQRPAPSPTQASPESDDSTRDHVVWGKTPSGEGAHHCLYLISPCSLTRVTTTVDAVFRVPTTHDVITALFHPSYPKSHIDIINLGLLALQLALFYALPRTPRKLFFFLYFAFWRAAYDAGLGYVLTKQSKRKWIVKTVQRLGWLDQNRRPEVRAWIRRQLVGKMGKDYSFDVRPFIHVVSSMPRLTAPYRNFLWNTTPGYSFAKPSTLS
jgi:phosphatidylethanolamine N-methyltransferase